MTWIPLFETLHNMLLYSEYQKRETEPQDSDRFKSAVVQAAAKSEFLAPENLEEPGHTVCVGASGKFNVRDLAHSAARLSS